MDHKTIVSEIAPCGLDCSRCVFFATGTVRNHADGLAAALEGFENMARLFASSNPALANYDKFLETLAFFRSGECKGCRNGSSCYDGCEAKNCIPTKGIDFCFECGSFPCDKNRYHPPLAEKWKNNNQTMKEKGIEHFYNEQKLKPRY